MLIFPSASVAAETFTRLTATVQMQLQRKTKPAASRQLMWHIFEPLVIPSGSELMSESTIILLGYRIP